MALTVAASLSISGSAGNSNAANAGLHAAAVAVAVAAANATAASPAVTASTVAATAAATAAGIAVAASRRLPEEDLEKALAAAKEALALAERRKEGRGCGKHSDACCNILKLVGSQKKSSLSLSTRGGASNAFSSLLCSSDLLLATPLAYRKRALRLLAGKVALAARFDVYGEKPPFGLDAEGDDDAAALGDSSSSSSSSSSSAAQQQTDTAENEGKSYANGELGKALRDGIVQALMKAQEPPPAPMKKALPAPEERSKPKRGGKRHRRLKEKYELSEVQKQLNRVKFGEQEDTIGLKAKGLGMLGKSIASGRLKLQTKQQKKAQLSQRRLQQLRPKGSGDGSSGSLASGSSTVGGFQSSLSFTPLQGIELTNPVAETELKQQQTSSAHNDYFAGGGRFTAVRFNVSCCCCCWCLLLLLLSPAAAAVSCCCCFLLLLFTAAAISCCCCSTLPQLLLLSAASAAPLAAAVTDAAARLLLSHILLLFLLLSQQQQLLLHPAAAAAAAAATSSSSKSSSRNSSNSSSRRKASSS
ncbi:hypothetical protein Emag_002478 [Eimeria magna]